MRNEKTSDLLKVRKPVYRVIEQDLRDRIRNGAWSSGAMLPSRKALAKEYGVDMRTIQHAIGDLLSDGTLTAELGRGTFVTTAIGAGVSGNTPAASETVVIIGDPSFDPGPGWSVVVHAMHEGLRRHTENSRIITINTADRTPEGVVRHEKDALKLVETERVGGVIMFHSGGEATLPDIRRILQAKVPVVFVDRVPFEYDCDFVGIDNRIAAREGVEYLLSEGHRRIAFLAPDEDVSSVKDRLEGYFDAYLGADITPSQDLIFRLPVAKFLSGDTLRAEISSAVDRLLALPEPPTAIFAVNDFLAEYLLIALEDHGVSVPDTLSVMGFDDVGRFLPQKPKLTTIRQPFEAIGERAASMLWWRMSHRDNVAGAFQHIMLPTRLVIRSSTRSIV